jgi:hypothetical protein
MIATPRSQMPSDSGVRSGPARDALEDRGRDAPNDERRGREQKRREIEQQHRRRDEEGGPEELHEQEGRIEIGGEMHAAEQRQAGDPDEEPILPQQGFAIDLLGHRAIPWVRCVRCISRPLAR